MSGHCSSGCMLFQIGGLAAGKLQSPKRVRVLGTMHVSTSAETCQRKPGCSRQQGRTVPSRATTFKLAGLAYSRQCRTGWRSLRTGVMWSRCRVPVIRWAAAFCTDCSRRNESVIPCSSVAVVESACNERMHSRLADVYSMIKLFWGFVFDCMCLFVW